MRLNLRYPPIPGFAGKHAELAVDSIRDVEGVSIDYTPDSLEILDRIIISLKEERVELNQIAETIFAFGCYAGEVMIRNLGGEWADPNKVLPPNIAQDSSMMVVKLAAGSVWNPIGKAFATFENGSVDSLAYLFTVAAAQ